MNQLRDALNSYLQPAVNRELLARTRQQLENEQKYGAITQGQPPMSFAESLMHGVKDLTGQNAMARGQGMAQQFRDTHGVMNPATMGEYAKTVAGQILPAVEIAGAAADVNAIAPILGRAAKPAAMTMRNSLNETLSANPGTFAENQAGMVAWHGSPHKFPPTETNPLGEFNLDKMGTGEGAQAYGWGQYLAEGKDTAKYYQDIGTQGNKIDTAENIKKRLPVIKEAHLKSIIHRLETGPQGLGYGSEANALDDEITNFERVVKRWKDIEKSPVALEKIKSLGYTPTEYKKLSEDVAALGEKAFVSPGHLYEVDLPDSEIDKMLDWDKPLSEQTYILDILGDLPEGMTPKHTTGEEYYRWQASGGAGMEDASKSLNSLGIPGIKYLDGTSRTAGEGTRNFVVFDPKKAKIIGRNGKRHPLLSSARSAKEIRLR